MEIRSGDVQRDSQACVALWMRAIESRDGAAAEPGTAERVERKFEKPIVRFAVAGAPVIAFALTTQDPFGGSDARLELLAVDPAHESAGLGQRLLRDSIGTAREAHFDVLQLDVREGNARATRLYERVGFASTGLSEPHPLGGAPMVRYALEL